jgi:hypothetical protein
VKSTDDRIGSDALECAQEVQRLVVAKARDEARKAKAEADLAEVVLKHAQENVNKLALPTIRGASS